MQEMRLQKFLAQAGVASRRASEQLILDGRVSVDGEKADTLGVKIDPSKQQVSVDGRPVQIEDKVYYLLNKPAGYVCTAEDRHAEKTVFDLMPKDARLHTVGRLDKDTEGLLILTNDGALTQALTHPSRKIDKTYRAVVQGSVSQGEIEKLRRGVTITEDDGTRIKTAPAGVKITAQGEKTTTLEITIHEGRKRQVRKMCQAVRHPVIHLTRIKEDFLTLAGLKRGAYRSLTAEEIKKLKHHV